MVPKSTVVKVQAFDLQEIGLHNTCNEYYELVGHNTCNEYYELVTNFEASIRILGVWFMRCTCTPGASNKFLLRGLVNATSL